MTPCSVNRNTMQRSICNIQNLGALVTEREQLISSIKSKMKGNTSGLRSLAALVGSNGFKKLLPSIQVRTLKLAQDLGPSTSVFDTMSRIVNTASFRGLKDSEIGIVFNWPAASYREGTEGIHKKLQKQQEGKMWNRIETYNHFVEMLVIQYIDGKNQELVELLHETLVRTLAGWNRNQW